MPRRNHLEPLRSANHRASLKGLRTSLKGGEGRDDVLFDLKDCADFHGKTLEEASNFMKPGSQQSIPKFSTQEVVVGELLGSGGYNLIFSLKGISLREDAKRNKSENDKRLFGTESSTTTTTATTTATTRQLQRLAFATVVNNCKEGSDYHHQYVVKFLKPDLKTKRLQSGALDLVREAKMLAHFQHENIIALGGLADESGVSGGGGGFAEGTIGYFLILKKPCCKESNVGNWHIDSIH